MNTSELRHILFRNLWVCRPCNGYLDDSHTYLDVAQYYSRACLIASKATRLRILWKWIWAHDNKKGKGRKWLAFPFDLIFAHRGLWATAVMNVPVDEFPVGWRPRMGVNLATTLKRSAASNIRSIRRFMRPCTLDVMTASTTYFPSACPRRSSNIAFSFCILATTADKILLDYLLILSSAEESDWARILKRGGALEGRVLEVTESRSEGFAMTLSRVHSFRSL